MAHERPPRFPGDTARVRGVTGAGCSCPLCGLPLYQNGPVGSIEGHPAHVGCAQVAHGSAASRHRAA